MPRVLEIGIPGLAKYLYPDAEIVDHLEENEEKVDAIVATNYLQLVPYQKEQEIINLWASQLAEGASLHVVVPSWEWVSRNVLAEDPIPIIKEFTGFNMFTMRQLRALVDRAGLACVAAKTGPYTFAEDYTAEQHYVCAIKKGTPT